MVILNKVYTYDQIINEIEELVCTYPGYLTYHAVGMSHDERMIPMVRLGKAKSCLICSAGIHGRESINPILLVKMLEDDCIQLTQGSDEESEELRVLLEKYSILFLPLVNPDGYEISLNGYQAIRNPKLRQSVLMDGIPASEWKYNARGVDINRNFPCNSFVPRGRMLSAASENETKALVEVFKQYKDSIGYIDFHSRGRVIYYFRNAMPDWFNTMGEQYAKHFQSLSGYDIGERTDEFEDRSSGGNSVNYYSEYFERMAITVETVEDEAQFPLDVTLQEKTYVEIHRLLTGFLKEHSSQSSYRQLISAAAKDRMRK